MESGAIVVVVIAIPFRAHKEQSHRMMRFTSGHAKANVTAPQWQLPSYFFIVETIPRSRRSLMLLDAGRSAWILHDT